MLAAPKLWISWHNREMELYPVEHGPWFRLLICPCWLLTCCATNMGKLLATGTQGPVTSGHWGWCWLPSSHRYIRCWQTTPSPPTVNLTASSAPELVFADASAGIGQGGCGGSANTKQITLSATSGGAPIAAQSAQYAKGGSNYNPIDMYFPFSLTFTLPAGQSGQIQLTGGENGLGCGSIQYAVYQL